MKDVLQTLDLAIDQQRSPAHIANFIAGQSGRAELVDVLNTLVENARLQRGEANHQLARPLPQFPAMNSSA